MTNAQHNAYATDVVDSDSRCEPDVERLVAEHLGFVDALAHRIRKKLPAHACIDELIAAGRLGLVQAAQRYDPNQGAQFKTFAYYRIRGAIFDAVRSASWMTTPVEQALSVAESTNELLERDAERYAERAGTESLAEQADSVRRVVRQVAMSKMLSLDYDPCPLEVADTASEAPGAGLERIQVHESLHSCIDRLPDRERQLIQDHYFSGLSLKDAGERQQRSKSWASRTHGDALELLLEQCRRAGIESSD